MGEPYNDWNDLIPLDQKAVDTAVTAVQIPASAVGGVKQIRIRVTTDTSGGHVTYIGTFGVTTNNGYPLVQRNAGLATSGSTPEFIINTTRPTEYYIISSAAGISVRILYLG